MKRMLKEVISKVMLVAIAVAVFVILPGLVGSFESHYNREATVVEIESDNTVVVEDTTHNVWVFEGTGYKVGDTVVMKMYTNHTDSMIEDDVIKNVKIVK